jgi:pilus assembly protein CpaC
LIVPLNGTKTVQVRSKKPIRDVSNPKPNVARVQPLQGDPTSILITGLDAGVTQVTITDVDGARDTIEVIVQLDVEYVRTQLTRVIPTANIQPIPGANNSIFLTGTVDRPEDIVIAERIAANVAGGAGQVVNALRVGGVQQVQLDVVVAKVSREEFRRMAFDFIEVGQHHIFSSTVGGGLFLPSTGITGTLPGAPVIQNTIGTPNGVPSNLFLGVFNPDQAFFGLLQALRDERLAKIMSKPTLVTLSGKPASFLDGGEQAVPVPAGLGQVGVQFEEFGTRLNFLPIVLGNGKIYLEVEPEVSNLDATAGTSIYGTTVPGRLTQRVHTSVQLEAGQTFVIGGMIQNTVTGQTSKVPILGDLPLIGAAFSRKSFDETETELILMVTPHLVDAMSCDQAPKLLPGQETRSPDDFELFLEGILEAPRGPRKVCQDHRYVPAYKNGPTAGLFPCPGEGHGRCDDPGFVNGQLKGACCNSPAVTPIAALDGQPSRVQDKMPPVDGRPAVTLPVAATAPGSTAPVNDNKPNPLPPDLPVSSGSSGRQ